MWSDPFDGRGFKKNKKRHAGFLWGEDRSKKFLERSRLILRGHQAVDGYEETHGK